MASYTVTLRADKAAYPVLLSNGNLVEQGDLRRTAATSRSGSTRSASPATCSRWSPASWWRASSASRARNGKEHLLQVYVRRRRPRQDRARDELADRLAWSGTRRASACRWTSTAS